MVALFLKGMTGALAAVNSQDLFIFFPVKGLYLGYLHILGSGVIDCQ